MGAALFGKGERVLRDSEHKGGAEAGPPWEARNQGLKWHQNPGPLYVMPLLCVCVLLNSTNMQPRMKIVLGWPKRSFGFFHMTALVVLCCL